MRCTYCNSDIPENSRFCPVCGAKQELAADVASAAVAANATDILAGIQANPQPAPDAAPSTPVQEFTQPAQVDTQPANNYTQPQQPYAQPQQPYAQPQQPYAQPQQPYAQPQQPYAQPQQDYTQPAAPLTAEKKKSKKGLIIGLCAGLALVAVALVLFFTLFSGSPVERALYGTLKDASDMLHAGNLGKVVSNIESVGKSGKEQETLRYDAADIGSAELTLNVDTKSTLANGALNFSAGEAGGTLRFALNSTEAQLAADGIDGVYGAKYSDLLQQMGMDADTLDELDLDGEEITLAKLKAGPLKPFFDSIQTNEVGQTRITAEGGDKVCKHYVLSWDQATLDELADKFEDMDEAEKINILASGDRVEAVSYLFATFLSQVKPSVDLYTNGNKLLGADVTRQEDNEVLYLRFLGDKNVWEHVRVSQTSSVTQFDLYWQKADSLRLCLTEDGPETEVFRYTDATGSFEVISDSPLDGMGISGTLLPDGRGAALNIRAAEDNTLNVSLNVQPLSEKPAMLGSDYTDLLTMTEEAQGQLLQRVSEQMKLDSLMGGLFGGFGDDDYDFDIDDPGYGFGDDTETWDWGDDDSDETEAPAAATGLTADDVAGSFDLDHLTAGGMDYDLSLIGMSAEDNYITLWSDGTGIIVLEGISAKINWSYDGTNLVISDRDTDGEAPYTLIVQDKDTILLDAESAYFVYKRDN